MIELDTQIVPTARAMSFLFWACSAFKVRKEFYVAGRMGFPSVQMGDLQIALQRMWASADFVIGYRLEFWSRCRIHSAFWTLWNICCRMLDAVRDRDKENEMENKERVEECLSCLEGAEKALREASVSMIESESDLDYSLLEIMLKESANIRRQMDVIKGIIPLMSGSSQHELSSAFHPSNSDINDSAFPICFVHNGFLYKIGLKEKEGYWSKKVSVQEAGEIMECIFSMDDDQFKQKDIVRKMKKETPIYRVGITVDALKQTGYIDSPHRGFYRVLKGNPSEWMENVKRIPERGDLVMKSRK